MLAEFSIYPMNTNHISKDLAKVAETLEKTGLKFRLGPMGTCIEGELGEVLAAVQRCHEVVTSNNERVITTITLDDHKDKSHHLQEMVSRVEKHLGHELPPT